MTRDDHHRVWPLPFGDRPSLDLRTDLGSLVVVPVKVGEEPRIEAVGRGADQLELRIERVQEQEQEQETVRVEVEPFRQFTWWGGWDTRLLAHVPPALVARIETGAGSIAIRGLDGATLAVRTNAGRIELTEVRGRLRLSADAGSIAAHAIAGALDIEAQAGSIRLEIAGLDPGEHRVHAGMGAIRVELAQGLDVRVETRTAMGSARNSYPAHPNAAAILSLATDMGSIRVSEGTTARWPGGATPAPPVAPAASAHGSPAATATTTATSAATAARDGDADLDRILAMVEAGQLSARDADDLLRALGRA